MNRRAMIKPLPRLALALLAICAPLALAACQQRETPALAGAAIGGPFTLSDKAGKPVHWSDFAGKWRIVYFGYTWCPDACPTDVAIVMKGFRQFAKEHPDQAAKVQPIFISVDPERDTPAKVGEFSAAFGPQLLGLTGTPEQVAAAAKAFAVYYAKGQQGAGGSYLVDHSRTAYLFDPEGKPIEILPTDLGDQKGPPAVAAELAKWVR